MEDQHFLETLFRNKGHRSGLADWFESSERAVVLTRFRSQDTCEPHSYTMLNRGATEGEGRPVSGGLSGTAVFKRSELIRHLRQHGAILLREGKLHSIYDRGRLSTKVFA